MSASKARPHRSSVRCRLRPRETTPEASCLDRDSNVECRHNSDQALDALAAQDGDFGSEVIAVDRGRPTDAEWLGAAVPGCQDPGGRFPDRHHPLNDGLHSLEGVAGLLLVQDAVPASPGGLRALVAPLLADD